MPYEIDLGRPPIGYQLAAGRDGETVPVQCMEFISSQDGAHFIRRLEGIPTDILTQIALQRPITPSTIDHLLAVVRGDGTATVYVNELDHVAPAHGRYGRGGYEIDCERENGAPRNRDDRSLDRFGEKQLDLGIDLPDDAGILFLFSVGWRKGLFYDFGPVLPNGRLRSFDCKRFVSQAYSYVLFQQRLCVTESQWQRLFAKRWFPFVALPEDLIEKLVDRVRSDGDPDDVTDEIVAHVRHRLPQMLECWRGHASFSRHIGFLQRAVERFTSGDHLSSVTLVFPQVEGILRTHRHLQDPTAPPCPETLADTPALSGHDDAACWLLPHRFCQYLREVYFANFDPLAKPIVVSRHSVAHGVVDEHAFDEKSSVIGFLVLHQLFHCLESATRA